MREMEKMDRGESEGDRGMENEREEGERGK